MVFLFLKKKNYEKSNVNLFYNYRIISFHFKQFDQVIEHDKLEVFHFLRLKKIIILLYWILDL